MRSDSIALIAAVAGCAVAAPAARPQWGSWGQDGGWGNGGGWGMGPVDPPASGSGAPAPSMPAPTGTAAPFPTGTGVAPIGTGVIPTGTGAVQPVRAAATTGTSPEASASPAASASSDSAAGQTGESTDAGGLNALFVAKGKEYFGTCADPGTLSSSETADIIKADFGQITPENRYDSRRSE